MNMRKISVEPKISTENMKKSPLKAGLLLNDQFTNYTYTFETGMQLIFLSKVKGEIEIGKNLSHALYGLVSSKFGNVLIGRNVSEMNGVDLYFIPRIKSFTFSPPYTGFNSYESIVELETEVFDKNGRMQRTISIKQEGSVNVLINATMNKTLQEMASGAINEAINNALQEFSRKLNEFY